MIESESNKNLIAKWINNDLDPELKAEYEKTEEFRIYQKILSVSDTLTPPSSDMKKMEEALFDKIDSKQSTPKKGKTVQLRYLWVVVAAAACIAFGLFWFGNATKEFATGYGEQIVVTLPDGSETFLDPKSTLSFKENNWKSDRSVNLIGEAFFKVRKGSDFQVQTPHGKVTVLGTQFNVRATEKMFEVTCSEGKVRVDTKLGNTVLLQKGKGYRTIEGKETSWDIDERSLSRSEEETSCYYLPLHEVLGLLESQFNVVFKNSNVDLQQHYTGVYNNKNIALALKTIFVPMRVKYELKGKNIIHISKK